MTRAFLTPALLALVVLAGCAKHPVVPPSAAAPAPTGASSTTVTPSAPTRAPATADIARSTTSPTTPTREAAARPSPADFHPVTSLADIHFDFDRSDIRTQDAKILEDNASWITGHKAARILIEGHCDERGTNEYNMALGDRRAKATRDFLVSHGVAGDRITLISYGEERPLCTEHTEACWARNRRAHFLATLE